jgi:hypothetical protein
MPCYIFEKNEYINGEWSPVTLSVGYSCWYSNFTEHKGEVTEALKKSLFILPELLQGSDYYGGTISVSNHKSFLEMYKQVEGVYNVYGDMGSYAVAVRMDVSEENEEIKSTLDALKDYGLIDEDDHSEVTTEWEDAALHDIVHDVSRHIDLEPYASDYDATDDTDVINDLVRDGISALNLNWHYENTSAYLDYKEVLPYVTDCLLITHCTDLPLLINREWSCKDTENRYKEKLTGTSTV